MVSRFKISLSCRRRRIRLSLQYNKWFRIGRFLSIQNVITALSKQVSVSIYNIVSKFKRHRNVIGPNFVYDFVGSIGIWIRPLHRDSETSPTGHWPPQPEDCGRTWFASSARWATPLHSGPGSSWTNDGWCVPSVRTHFKHKLQSQPNS